MKKRDAYDLEFNDEMTGFWFESTGTKGVIEKIIEFKYYRKNRWNLAFGDVKGDEWEDNKTSDNGDMREVLQTVVNAVHLFTKRYPGRKVYIEPLDRQRKILYNRIFQQKWEEIKPLFTVRGISFTGEKELSEKYHPRKTYDAFVLHRKQPTFGQ